MLVGFGFKFFIFILIVVGLFLFFLGIYVINCFYNLELVCCFGFIFFGDKVIKGM